jgi:4a-hydroxytetrahydrobiopterin dehydratase
MSLAKKLTADNRLSPQELDAAIQNLPSWRLNSQRKLEREFAFRTFPEAFSFMTRVAFEAERLNHHPDWSNSYNRVKIELMTHDAGGITEKDVELARIISAIDWT